MDYCLSLPFDQYQRYKLVSDIIDKFRTKERKFKILDVGAGFEENLKKFLPFDDIYCLDKEYPPEYSHKEYFIKGDILMMEFIEKYDFVVAIDVYEHISQIDRKKFIDILIPLSDIATIIAAPFDQDEVRKCEFFANEVYRNSHGSDHIWLKEHISNGLPSLSHTIKIFENNNLNCVRIPNGYLPRWFEMISTYLMTENNTQFSQIMSELYEFYNIHYYPYDNKDPAYRQILIISKDKLPNFSDLISIDDQPDKISDEDKLLKSFTEKIRKMFEFDKVSCLSQTITILNQTLTSKELQLTDITNHVSNLNQVIANKDCAIENKDLQLLDITNHVSNLNQVIANKDQELTQIKSSIIWQTTMKFQKKVLDRLFKQGTRRRKIHDLGIKGSKILFNEGLNSFWRQFKEKLLHKPIPWKKITVPSINITGIQNSDDITPIATSVSIIIPTKNAGPDFEANLEKISQQKGVQTIEIIIIDSGSTDKTLEIARKYGAKIFQIDPENFNHGTTRNFGAENATGEYLCFLVQDAFPIGHYWLYEMVNVLDRDQQIAAATCRQIPRSDADLFACFGLWQHYTYTLDSQSDRVYGYQGDFNTLPGEEKRRLAGLDDVSCLIRKIIFEKYRFRKIQSSEDLDLGKRFIQDGYKNAFLFSVGVIHSHNRDAGYFLNRSFIDTKTVSEIVGYNTQQITDNCTLSETFGSIITLYNSLNFTLFSLGKSAFSLPTRELCLKIRSNMVNNFRYCENNSDQNTSLLENNEHSPGNAIVALTKHLDHKPEYSNINQNNLILDQYVWVINNFLGYIEIFDSIEDKKDEFIECYYKIFSVVAGASLASYYLHKSEKNDMGKELELINLELSKGV